MEQYPSILGSSKAPLGKPCIAFNKYDGSNLRFEWSPKQGWHKFGTRRQLFDERTPIFGKAIQHFDLMADEIVRRVRDRVKNPQRITAFAEFFGPGSFAGSHLEGEEQELRLFDIFLFKQGKYNVFEGVVAKGSDFMIKIKTDEYFKKLRQKYPERWEEFGE